MSSKILMPALSPTMTEGIINQWLVKIGDTVKLWDFDSDLSKVSEEFNTISYNLLTNISSRVTKNYLE